MNFFLQEGPQIPIFTWHSVKNICKTLNPSETFKTQLQAGSSPPPSPRVFKPISAGGGDWARPYLYYCSGYLPLTPVVIG